MEKQIFFNFNLKFNLRDYKALNKASILYAVICYKKRQYKVNTGVKIYPSQFDNNRQIARQGQGLTSLDLNNNMIANSKIKDISFAFENLKSYLCDNYTEINDTNLYQIIKTFINPNIITKKMVKKTLIENATITLGKTIENNMNSGESSKRLYRGHLNQFKAYLNKTNITDSWDNINLKILENWRLYMINKGEVNNSINGKLKTIQRCCKQVDEIPNVWNYIDSKISKLELVPNKLSKKDKNEQQIALTEEEIMKIYNCNTLTPEHREIRDIFVLQCLTGQRISDMDKISNCLHINNDDTITITQQKTKEQATIPLFEITKIILEKYKEGFKYFDIKKPRCKDRINKGIKIVAEEAGLTDIIPHKKQKGIELEDITERMCDRIHTHTARHSFITIMCRLNIPKEIIIICTGHSNTKMIDTVYEHLNTADKQSKVSMAFNDLNSTLFTMNGNKKETAIKEKVQIQQQEPQQAQQQIQQNDTVNEAKEVLSMLRVDPSIFFQENDISTLWRMVVNVENELLDFGINYEIVKKIFNENKSLKERAEILHQIYVEARAIKEVQ